MSEENNPKLPTGEVGVEVNDVGAVNPDAVKQVELDNELKSWFVNYVGEKHKPEDGVVTVAMSIATMAEEFPEFLMALAEENWIRGYHQALTDVEVGERLAKEQTELNEVDSKISK